MEPSPVTTNSNRESARLARALGRNIREHRQRSGATIADIHDHLGLSPISNTLYQWERGDHFPRLDYLYRLADFLGVSVVDLLPLE